jgi:hypothetical protein
LSFKFVPKTSPHRHGVFITDDGSLISNDHVVKSAAVVQFQGNPNQTYFLQAAETLSSPSWVNVTTNQTDSAGFGTLRDEQAKEHTIRFYRVATP